MREGRKREHECSTTEERIAAAHTHTRTRLTHEKREEKNPLCSCILFFVHFLYHLGGNTRCVFVSVCLHRAARDFLWWSFSRFDEQMRERNNWSFFSWRPPPKKNGLPRLESYKRSRGGEEQIGLLLLLAVSLSEATVISKVNLSSV